MKKAHFDDRPTLILIHGMRGDHHGLVDLARYLRSEYNVLLPDLPGSGDRAELENKTIDGYAEWFHQYISSQKLTQKPVIIAHSMGSIVVSHFLQKYPQDINSQIIYLAPVFRTAKSQKQSERSFHRLKRLLSTLPRGMRFSLERSKLLSYIISHVLTYDKTQQHRIDQLHFRYSGRFASPESLLADIEISMLHTTQLDSTKNTLAIIGQGDALTSPVLAVKRCKKYNTNYEIIKEAGHLMNYECPARVARLILDFLK